MRPRSIVLFEFLYLASIAVGLLNTVVSWERSLAMLQARPGVQFGENFLYFATALGLVISLLLWFFIARRASIVAKWILVVLFGFGLVSLIGIAGNSMMAGGMSALLQIAAIVLQGAAVVMLFRSDANAWLKSGGAP